MYFMYNCSTGNKKAQDRVERSIVPPEPALGLQGSLQFRIRFSSGSILKQRMHRTITLQVWYIHWQYVVYMHVMRKH